MNKLKTLINPDPMADTNNNHKIIVLRKMKILATLLFILLTLIFIASSLLEKSIPFFSYVKAFSEAGMVGALADWFAVVALFKKPLGFPFHTAIIPSNKDRIGNSLANFIKDNFLTKEVLNEKIASWNIAETASNWLSNIENAKLISKLVSKWTPRIMEELDDQDINQLIRKNLINKFKEINFSKLLGEILDILTSDNKHLNLLDEILAGISRYINNNKEKIFKAVEHKKPFFLPKFIYDGIINYLLNKIKEFIKEIRLNKKHNIRTDFNTAVKNFINDLKNTDKFKKREDKLKEKIVNNELILEYIDGIWSEIKKRIIDDLRSDNSQIRDIIENSITSIGSSIARDNNIKGKINNWVTEFLVENISQSSDKITTVISDTIKKWDSKWMSKKLELEIGKDLQYIRINGALVGGVVGLIIYLASRLI